MFAAWLLLSLAIGAGGTWLARRYALRHALLDAPGERRAHTEPTPRGGGIGIVVVLLVAGLWLWRTTPEPIAISTTWIGIALVAAVGLVDDHRPLSPWWRLGVQAMASGLLAFGTWQATGDAWPAIAAFVSAMVLTNVWNFMDGIDGIAGTQAVLVALAIGAAHSGAWAWWAFALAAAVAGFLPFNVPKARIFLGDVGSGTLGFALAAFLVHALADAPASDWWPWALPLSAFLIDASLTLAGRVRRGERWWTPHALHAYQRWARASGSHMVVTAAYAAWTVASILLLFLLEAAPASSPWAKHGVLAVVVAWYIGGTRIWLLLQGPKSHGKGVPR